MGFRERAAVREQEREDHEARELERRIGALANLSAEACERQAYRLFLQGIDTTHGPTLSAYYGEANFYMNLAVLKTVREAQANPAIAQ